jgi:hypothetical protein
VLVMWPADGNSGLQVRERGGPERGAPASRDEKQLPCVKRLWPGHQLARKHPPRWLRELWPRSASS